MAFDFINRAIDKMVGIGVGKAKNAISDIANDTTTAVKNVGSSIVDTAKEANYQFGKSISENLVEPIKANLADKGVDLTKPAEGTTFQQAVEYAKRVPIAGTAIFDQFAIKNPTKVIGQAVDLYSDYRDDNQLNASSKIGAKTGDIIQTFGENVGFQKPVTSAGDVFNAGEALINSETKAQVIDNGLKVGNSLFQTVMNASKVANVVGGAFQTGMKESGADVPVENVTKQGAGMLSDSLQSVGVEKNDADSLGRTLIDTIITVVSLGGYAKGSSKVGGYKKVASNMAQEDLKAALKTKTIPKSDATSFLLSRTKEIESNLRPVDVMKYNAGKILTDVKYQSAVPIITAIIDGVQNGFDEQKRKDAWKAITATAGSTIIGGVVPPIKKSKAPTVDEAQTKIAIDETPTPTTTPKVDTIQDVKPVDTTPTPTQEVKVAPTVPKSPSRSEDILLEHPVQRQSSVEVSDQAMKRYDDIMEKLEPEIIKNLKGLNQGLFGQYKKNVLSYLTKSQIESGLDTGSRAAINRAIKDRVNTIFDNIANNREIPTQIKAKVATPIETNPTPTPTPTPDTPINNIRSTKGSNDFVDYFQKKLGDNITKEGLLKFGFTEKQIFDNTFDSLKTESNKLGVSLEDLFEIAKKAEADKILTKPIKEAPTPTPTPTPTPLGSLASLVETYKGDGKTKGKVGSIQVDFENPLNKVLYSIRESKNKLKPVEEKAIQELARLSGMDEAQIRKLGEDVSKQIKDKIYREKAVTPEGVKLSSTKDKVDDNINIPKEDDILGLNDTPPTPKAKKEVSPLTQRYQELIANNAKEGDKINTVKGIFDLGKTFNKVFSHLDRIASTKTLLNNFRIGDAKELVGSYLESKQARDYSQIATEGLNHFNAEGLTKDLAFKPKRELTQQDLIGSTTPNGFKIDDPKLAKEAFDTYLLDSEKFLERTVPLVAKGVASKDILQATRNSAIYNSFKNDPAKLNEFFTPEQIAIFQKLGSEVASIESTLVKSGQDIGVIPDYIDPESGYLRKVTTGRAAERAGKFKQTENDGKIEVTLADGTVMKVDNFDDALRVSQINADGHTLNPEAMSSLTKKQAGPEYDPFRLHGDYASILSLNDAIGKLYADKNALKVIDTVLEKGDTAYTSAMKNKAYGLMAKDVLGIRGTQGQDVLDKTARVAGRLGVAGTMLYNVKNMGWNVVPSYVRTGVRSLMDFASAVEQRTKKEGMKGFTGAFKDAKISQIMKSMRNEQVDARLRGLGAINEFNIDNASAASKLEGQLMYMSNGTWAEIPGSKLAAVLSMANSLNRAGRLEGAKDANGVIDRWEAWQKEGGQEFYESRGALDDTLRSLGKTDASDKMNLPFVPASVNGALGSLKSWSTSQAASKKEMINTIVRNAYEVATKKTRSYTDRQSEEATKDLAARTLTFLATAEVIKQSLFAQGELDENDDPDLIRDTVRSATTGVIADPLTPYLWSIYNAGTSGSVALSVPANIAKGAYQLAMAGGKEIFGDEKEAQAYLRDSLASFGKIGSIRGISDTFGIFNKGDSLQDLLANKAGTFSKEEANASGVASGKDWDSASSRASKLGFVNAEQAKQDALYAMKNRLDAPDWVNKVPYGDIVFNAIKQEMKPVLDYFDDQEGDKSTPGDILDKSIRAGYAYDVVKDLKNSKDTNDFLQKNGLEGKDAMVQQLLTDLIKSNISQNKNVDERFTQLVQVLSPNTFLQDMDKIRELDPYLYNNIVATFGELKAIRNEAGSLSLDAFNNTVIDRIKNKTNSISQEDYAISQANDDYALTTSFTNAIGNEIANVEKDLGKSNPKEAKEKLDKLEKLSAVMNSPSIYSYKIPFANLIANNATNLLQVFTDLKADNNSYPFLKNAMLFGAQVVRGAKEGQPEKPPVTPTPPTPLSGTTLRSMIGSRPAVVIDKPAVVSNITIDKPLKVGSSKVGQTLVKLPMSEGKQNTQTLSSMVKRKSPKL